MISEIYLNYSKDQSAREKFLIPGKVPEVFLEEGKQPSLLESNLWLYVGETVEALQRQDEPEIERHQSVDIRRSVSYVSSASGGASTPRLMHPGECYRVMLWREGIRVIDEPERSIYDTIEAEAARVVGK